MLTSRQLRGYFPDLKPCPAFQDDRTQRGNQHDQGKQALDKVTGRNFAARMIADWNLFVQQFIKVPPVGYRR